MTAIDRFDPFEQRITAAIDEIAAPRRPDYLDDILRQTARTSQRPRWTFPGTWLPVDATLPARSGPLGRLSARPALLLVLLLLLLAAAAVLVVGSRNRVPEPFGLADNGQLAYAFNGDVWVRDTLTAPGRVLIATPGKDVWPYFSPDGTRLLLTIEQADGKAYDYVANADGTGLRKILPDPIVGSGFWAWAPDSRTIAIVNEVGGFPVLHIASVDDPAVRTVDLGGISVREISWRPGGARHDPAPGHDPGRAQRPLHGPGRRQRPAAPRPADQAVVVRGRLHELRGHLVAGRRDHRLQLRRDRSRVARAPTSGCTSWTRTVRTIGPSCRRTTLGCRRPGRSTRPTDAGSSSTAGRGRATTAARGGSPSFRLTDQRRPATSVPGSRAARTPASSRPGRRTGPGS